MSFTQYLASFIRRLSVPHCEDCKHVYRSYVCIHPVTRGPEYLGWGNVDVMRSRGMPCGNRGKLFEPKEGV